MADQQAGKRYAQAAFDIATRDGTVAQWRSGEGTIWMRLRHSGAVIVALLFFWSFNTWNLLGWRM